MNSAGHANGTLRGGKKMKKRKELDALVAHSMNKRATEGGKRSSSAGGVSSHDTLLTDSTDEQEYWTSPGGGKLLRPRCRRYLARRRACSAFLRVCSAVLVFTCFVATTTVMWLFIDVREQVTSLRTELNQAVAGNQKVPEALQHCHSLSHNLQKNQTQIIERLSAFDTLLSNFSQEMADVKTGLHAVQDQLRASPDLVSNPRMVKDLFASVATFGSQIKDLNSTVLKLRDRDTQLDDGLRALVANVTELAGRVAAMSRDGDDRSALTEKDLAAEKEAILNIVSQVASNLSTVNDTLSNKLQWNVDGQSADHKLLGSLQEMNQNVTARVRTLEALCVKSPEAAKAAKAGSGPAAEPKHDPTAWTLPFAPQNSPTVAQQPNTTDPSEEKPQPP